ncbi:DUF2867 domain-containing protein [Arthrobacter sp. ISL-30]|nr:DUF2867 domain-containing protein [Arthrobacter sp. ISL-30]
MPRPDYADVIVVPCPRPATTDPRVWAETLFSLHSTPGWVRTLMAIRQGLVGLLGIPRAPVDVFAVARVEGEEALIAADDKHLDFRCGVAFDAGTRLLRLTTTVQLKGWRGRIYFAPVRVVHPLVVRSMMLRAVTILRETDTG